jgi:integrase
VAELGTDQVATFAIAEKPHVAPDTLNRDFVTPYSSVLHYAYEIKWCGDPMIRRFQEQEDEIKAVTPAEVNLLVANVDATASYKKAAHARKDKNAAYKVAFLELLRQRGTRISDVLALQRPRDLDLPGMRVRFTIGKRRDKVQWLPINPKLVAMFANLAPCDGVYLLPWRTKSGVYKWLRPLCQRLGLKVTPHMFRHALGEEAMDAEIDVITLMNMGAWASLNSARRYARSSPKRLEQADRKRAEEAGSPDHRQMTAADLELPPIDNIVTLERKKA